MISLVLGYQERAFSSSASLTRRMLTTCVASPALTVIEQLKKRGATVDYHDPLVPTIPLTRNHSALAGMESLQVLDEKIGSYHAVVILTDHDVVAWESIVQYSRLIVDTRNAIGRSNTKASASSVVRA